MLTKKLLNFQNSAKFGFKKRKIPNSIVFLQARKRKIGKKGKKGKGKGGKNGKK